MNQKLKWAGKHFEEIVSCAGFTLMLVMVTINVFARYVFSRSFSFTEELSYLGFNYSVFFGMCILYKNCGMISIDIVVDRLPKAAQRVVQTLTYLLLTAGNAIMVYYSGKLALEAWVRPTAALRIPYTFIDAAAVFAFIILTFYSIRFLIHVLQGRELKTTSLEERA